MEDGGVKMEGEGWKIEDGGRRSQANAAHGWRRGRD